MRPAASQEPADRWDHRHGNDDDTRAGNLFRLLDDGHRERRCANITEAKAGVPDAIVRRQIAHLSNAAPAYRAGVAEALGNAPGQECSGIVANSPNQPSL